MIDQNQQPTPDILDRATEALRTAPISGSPPPRLVAETIAALQPLAVPSNTPQLQQRRQRMFRVARYSGVAAAILLLAFGAAMFWPWDRGGAFGQAKFTFIP